jgi:hypothetical protein
MTHCAGCAERRVANQGAAGVDGQSIAAFEANLSGNLYKLWNRMSSGSYFPCMSELQLPQSSLSRLMLGSSSPGYTSAAPQDPVQKFQLRPSLIAWTCCVFGRRAASGCRLNRRLSKFILVSNGVQL